MPRPPELGRTLQGKRVRLGLRNLYILPTRFGWLWLAGALLLQVVGVQMQANGSLLLSFLMLGLFLLALHLTHFNLQGVELACGNPAPGFSGSPCAYPLIVRCRGHCEGLRLGLGDGALSAPRALPPGEHRLAVPWIPTARGAQRPGRLRLQTTAPLGLFVCWSRWEPAEPQLVWPARRPGPVRLQPHPSPEEPEFSRAPSRREGVGDWHDLRPHRVGEGPGRVAWKLVAGGRGQHVKCFAAPLPATPLLSPEPGVPKEQALEHLAERVWRMQAAGTSYGLALPGGTISPAVGTAHRDRCLNALALCP